MPQQQRRYNFTPGSREWYADQLYGTVPPVDTARQNADSAEFIASMAPVTGELMAARDAWNASGRAAQAVQKGELSRALSEYGGVAAGVLGAIPGLGMIARGTKRGALWMDRNAPGWLNRGLDAMAPQDAKNTTYIFAGPTAKNADKAALAKAQELAQSGASRDEIWNQTGWFQGVDGKWRFEIDDSQMAVRVPKNKWSGEYGSYKSSIHHPELFGAYPPMQRNRITFDHRTKDSGIVTAKPGEQVLDLRQFDTDIGVEGRVRTDRTQSRPYEIQKKTVHELQHNVQMREGFAAGGSPEEIWQSAQDIGKPLSSKQAIDAYRRLAGEVEARNAEMRTLFSPETRRAQPPWKTQDVPDDQQLVVFDNRDMASSDELINILNKSGPSPSGTPKAAKSGRGSFEPNVKRKNEIRSPTYNLNQKAILNNDRS